MDLPKDSSIIVQSTPQGKNFFFDEFQKVKDPEKMTRKERRAWYHKHRKKLRLPRWGELSNLK